VKGLVSQTPSFHTLQSRDTLHWTSVQWTIPAVIVLFSTEKYGAPCVAPKYGVPQRPLDIPIAAAPDLPALLALLPVAANASI
jgi:hypothetical protein